MIKLAKSLELQGGIIQDILHKLDGRMIPVAALTEVKKSIESQIEHSQGQKFFKMNVRMAGVDQLPFEQRQELSERFLRDMEALFENYKIIRVEGTYDKPL